MSEGVGEKKKTPGFSISKGGKKGQRLSGLEQGDPHRVDLVDEIKEEGGVHFCRR